MELLISGRTQQQPCPTRVCHFRGMDLADSSPTAETFPKIFGWRPGMPCCSVMSRCDLLQLLAIGARRRVSLQERLSRALRRNCRPAAGGSSRKVLKLVPEVGRAGLEFHVAGNERG